MYNVYIVQTFGPYIIQTFGPYIVQTSGPNFVQTSVPYIVQISGPHIVQTFGPVFVGKCVTKLTLFLFCHTWFIWQSWKMFPNLQAQFAENILVFSSFKTFYY